MAILDGTNSTADDRLDVTPGGYLVGPGTETSDDISALMPLGAYILNAEAVKVIGRESLDAVLHLAAQVRIHAKLSAAEYVVPPQVVMLMGKTFWNQLNTAGQILRANGSPDPDRHAELMRGRIKAAIEVLSEMHQNPRGDLVTRMLRDAINQCETGKFANDDPAIRLSGGGIGIALGAAVDEYHRLNAEDRANKADARADEQLKINQQAATQTGQVRGMQLMKLKREEDDATAVRSHLKSWVDGRQKIAAGDMSPLEGELNEYNQNRGAYADGYTFAAQSTPEGTVLHHIDSNGDIKATYRAKDALPLFDAGMAKKLEFISPTYFEHARKASAEAAQKEADRASREKIAQTYADSRMYGADTRADAQVEAAGIRADRPAGGLTAAQQRSNAEIDAARAQLEKLSPEDIRHRSTSALASGRENPAFDPAIARAARLAGRLKYGEQSQAQPQPTHQSELAHSMSGRESGQDTFAGKPLSALQDDQLVTYSKSAGPQAAGRLQAELTRRQDRASRFAADPATKGYRLGGIDPDNGLPQVLDPTGKVVGHFR